VYGKIFTIQEVQKLLAALDAYEEAGDNFPSPNEYRRTKVRVYTLQNEEISAWLYVYNHPTGHLEQIVSGEWGING
jgi:gamma-glutamylcyclotransferase (GGCT)/AIG2-like uncharacterized protein YtfP